MAFSTRSTYSVSGLSVRKLTAPFMISPLFLVVRILCFLAKVDSLSSL